MENRSACQTPIERYRDAVLELVVSEMVMEELREAEQPLEPEAERALAAQARASMPRMLGLIRARRRGDRRRAFLRRGLPRLLKVAAILLLALNLGVTVAAAVSDTVRAHVLEFMFNVKEEYTEIQFARTGAEVDVPEQWTLRYYPTYIPEGYVLYDVAGMEDMGTVTYVGEGENYLRFSVSDLSTETSIDTEDSEITYGKIHGSEALFSEKEGRMTIIWHEGEWMYDVLYQNKSMSAEQIREEALKIAESVSLIQK